MANHNQHEENYESNPGVMYESSDANVRAIYLFGFWLVVLGLLCALATYGGLRAMEAWEDHQDKARMAENPMVPEARMKMPPVQAVHEFPNPALQVNDTAEMKEEIEEENAKLTHYQWVDPNQGIVRIPIDRAMQLVLEHGLPARAPGAGAAANPGTLVRDAGGEKVYSMPGGEKFYVGDPGPLPPKRATKPAPAAKKPAANVPGKPASQQVR